MQSLITQQSAKALARKYLDEKFDINNATEILPASCNAYNAPKNCWYVLCNYQTNPSIQIIGSSRLLCIDKVTGAVVYDGPAGDEG